MFIPALPLSGVAGYRYIQQTEQQQKQAMLETPEIKRDVEYFKQAIGTVGSVDDLLNDRRLLEVALTAYGLESEIDKTVFIRNVLTSDVSVSGSFANRLNDQRWRDMARDFGFGDPGAGRAETPLQIAVNLRADGATSEFQPSSKTRIAASELAYFRANAPSLTSIDGLLSDKRLLDAALAGFGLDREYYSDAAIRDFIENGVDTTQGGPEFQEAYGDELAAWASFAAAFDSLKAGETVNQWSVFGMRVDQAVIERGVSYELDQDVADADSGKMTAADLINFRSAVESMASAADLVGDPASLKVVKIAFGVEDEVLSADLIEQLLEGGPNGALAREQSNQGWRDMASAFQEGFTSAGQIRVEDFVRDWEIEVALDDLEEKPTDPQPPRPPAIDPDDLAYFNERIGDIEGAAGLVADARLLEVALTAFGLEDENRSVEFLEDILSEDPYADDAFVNQLSDTRWRDFAQAFIPPSDGAGVGRNVIQYELESRLEEIGAPQADITYLRKNMNLVDQPLDLIFDEQLKDIALSAFGLEKETYSNTFVGSILIADVTDPNSFVNRLNDPRWLEFAQTFGEGARVGNVRLETFQQDVIQKFEERSFELAVGAQDQDLRLALNFRRGIQTIAESPDVAEVGWFQLMGDSALREVVDGMFGLPTEFSQLDLSAQVLELEDRTERLFGVKDPSAFLDPDSVDTAITRFLSLREQAAQQATATAVSLLEQSVSLARGVNVRV